MPTVNIDDFYESLNFVSCLFLSIANNKVFLSKTIDFFHFKQKNFTPLSRRAE